MAPRNFMLFRGVLMLKLTKNHKQDPIGGQPMKTGYRNIFKEIGKSDEEIEKKIRDAVQTFFWDEEERIYHEAGSDMGYLTDTGNNDARTEGMSYGMMMCVQLDMKEEFDRIWKWSKTYMYMTEGENEGYFAWSCQTDGKKNAMGPAPDGEEFFAMALFFASHRWGNGEGIFDYESEARSILRACLHKGENGRAGYPMWNRDNRQILFVPGSPFTDPSYHLPHFYELFAERADKCDRNFWKACAKASREYLTKACHPVTGLAAEYADDEGKPLPKVFPDGKKLPWGNHGTFFSDSYRVAANIGLDALWFGSVSAASIAANIIHFFDGKKAEDLHDYEINGKELKKLARHPIGLIATVAQAALATGELSEEARRAVKRLWETPMRTGRRRYYDNCLYFFAILALSGKYVIW